MGVAGWRGQPCLALSREVAVHQAPAPFVPQLGALSRTGDAVLRIALCSSDPWYLIPEEGH